jgi:hypothetical protein
MSITGSVRIMLPCGDCGTELKEAELDFDMSFDHECPTGTPALDEGEEPFDFESEPDGGPTDRLEDKDRRGKPIKSARYMKHYYGADLTAQVKCNRCGEIIDVNTSVEEQASGFNELV